MLVCQMALLSLHPNGVRQVNRYDALFVVGCWEMTYLQVVCRIQYGDQGFVTQLFWDNCSRLNIPSTVTEKGGQVSLEDWRIEFWSSNKRDEDMKKDGLFKIWRLWSWITMEPLFIKIFSGVSYTCYGYNLIRHWTKRIAGTFRAGLKCQTLKK